MTLSVPIAPDIETKLRERAAQFGRDVTEYAAELIREGVCAPTFDELLDPVRQDFARSGMSEEEIMILGRRELDALRAEKKAQSP